MLIFKDLRRGVVIFDAIKCTYEIKIPENLCGRRDSALEHLRKCIETHIAAIFASALLVKISSSVNSETFKSYQLI